MFNPLNNAIKFKKREKRGEGVKNVAYNFEKIYFNSPFSINN